MLLVVDANVLVSELLRIRGHALVGNHALDLRMSEEAMDEARYETARRAEKIVAQGRASQQATDTMLDEGRNLIERRILTVPREAYSGCEERASYRIPRDPDDAPTVALALALGGDEGRCGIWTNDGDFLGCGVPTWTTETLIPHLRHTNEQSGN